MKEAADSLGDAIGEAMDELVAVYRCGLRYLPITLIFCVLMIFMAVTL